VSKGIYVILKKIFQIRPIYSDMEKERSLNPKILETLHAAMDKANLPGEDYYELTKAVEAMKNIPLTEEDKLKTAVAALSTKGLTIAKVLESASYYLEILDNEKKKFYLAFENKIKDSINADRKKIEDLFQSIKDKNLQIEDLKRVIEESKTKITELESEISKSEGKVNEIEESFLFTYDHVVSKIKNDIEKIKLLQI
jgi:predicted RNase H-like nuclease (RuvC/YqgF family)